MSHIASKEEMRQLAERLTGVTIGETLDPLPGAEDFKQFVGFVPPPTAYDRAQASLAESITRIDQIHSQYTRDTNGRLDAALRRIEALELEVARLKGPQEPQEPFNNAKAIKEWQREHWPRAPEDYKP